MEEKLIYTISFNDDIKGWTSFHSFHPEWMIGIGNEFYSFNNGELFIHHQNDVPRNRFYGVQYPSKVSLMFNNSPSDIKELKAVSLEGSHPWNIDIKAFITSQNDFTGSSIDDIEFVNKEGLWYAYARRNENPNQLDSKSAYGVGSVIVVNPADITVNGFNESLAVGDLIVKSDMTVIGEIISHRTVNSLSTIELSTTTGLNIGDFVIGVKDARIEGGNLRGYTIRFDMEIQKDEKVELFAVNSEINKSYP